MIHPLLAALLLILSFPHFSVWPLAWVAFVPVFAILGRTKYKSFSFFYFFFVGFFFFFASVEWLRHVTYFGWMFVASFFAIYFGLFGLAVHWFWKRGLYFLSLFVLPSIWVVLEWLRSEIPVWTFGWNLLAYSQADNLQVAKLASFVGAYGVSWLIIFVNLTTYFVLDHEFRKRKHAVVTILTAIGILVGIFALVSAFSSSQDGDRGGADNPALHIAVIQGNIPQDNKWDPKSKASILDIHEKLSRLVTFEEKPDLIVWPEAAFPGYINVDRERERIFKLVDELKTPILLGSPYLERDAQTQDRAFNSAFLIDQNHLLNERYDKIRLVPFGEYVPFRFFFNLFGLERYAYSLGVSDFQAGGEMKVFSLENKFKFSTLICFEDTFPLLSRKAVLNGAQFLVVVTNDAWFSKSAAPHQHLEASIFRAIETGVPVIRSANTGISAFISGNGEVLDRVKDKFGNDIFVYGGLLRPVELQSKKTWYLRGGYYFTHLCLCVSLLGFLAGIRKKTVL